MVRYSFRRRKTLVNDIICNFRVILNKILNAVNFIKMKTKLQLNMIGQITMLVNIISRNEDILTEENQCRWRESLAIKKSVNCAVAEEITSPSSTTCSFLNSSVPVIAQCYDCTCT